MSSPRRRFVPASIAHPEDRADYLTAGLRLGQKVRLRVGIGDVTGTYAAHPFVVENPSAANNHRATRADRTRLAIVTDDGQVALIPTSDVVWLAPTPYFNP